jgi:hypothetical protein
MQCSFPTGYTVWVDRHDESAGRYAGEIVRAIRSNRVVALMASTNSFSSAQVAREVYVAGEHKKPFISILLDQSELPDDFQYCCRALRGRAADPTRLAQVPVVTIHCISDN